MAVLDVGYLVLFELCSISTTSNLHRVIDPFGARPNEVSEDSRGGRNMLAFGGPRTEQRNLKS
jgi:hypothetical protein